MGDENTSPSSQSLSDTIFKPREQKRPFQNPNYHESTLAAEFSGAWGSESDSSICQPRPRNLLKQKDCNLTFNESQSVDTSVVSVCSFRKKSCNILKERIANVNLPSFDVDQSYNESVSQFNNDSFVQHKPHFKFDIPSELTFAISSSEVTSKESSHVSSDYPNSSRQTISSSHSFSLSSLNDTKNVSRKSEIDSSVLADQSASQNTSLASTNEEGRGDEKSNDQTLSAESIQDSSLTDECTIQTSSSSHNISKKSESSNNDESNVSISDSSSSCKNELSSVSRQARFQNTGNTFTKNDTSNFLPDIPMITCGATPSKYDQTDKSMNLNDISGTSEPPKIQNNTYTISSTRKSSEVVLSDSIATTPPSKTSMIVKNNEDEQDVESSVDNDAKLETDVTSQNSFEAPENVGNVTCSETSREINSSSDESSRSISKSRNTSYVSNSNVGLSQESVIIPKPDERRNCLELLKDRSCPIDFDGLTSQNDEIDETFSLAIDDSKDVTSQSVHRTNNKFNLFRNESHPIDFTTNQSHITTSDDTVMVERKRFQFKVAQENNLTFSGSTFQSSSECTLKNASLMTCANYSALVEEASVTVVDQSENYARSVQTGSDSVVVEVVESSKLNLENDVSTEVLDEGKLHPSKCEEPVDSFVQNSNDVSHVTNGGSQESVLLSNPANKRNHLQLLGKRSCRINFEDDPNEDTIISDTHSQKIDDSKKSIAILENEQKKSKLNLLKKKSYSINFSMDRSRDTTSDETLFVKRKRFEFDVARDDDLTFSGLTSQSSLGTVREDSSLTTCDTYSDLVEENSVTLTEESENYDERTLQSNVSVLSESKKNDENNYEDSHSATFGMAEPSQSESGNHVSAEVSYDESLSQSKSSKEIDENSLEVQDDSPTNEITDSSNILRAETEIPHHGILNHTVVLERTHDNHCHVHSIQSINQENIPNTNESVRSEIRNDPQITMDISNLSDLMQSGNAVSKCSVQNTFNISVDTDHREVDASDESHEEAEKSRRSRLKLQDDPFTIVSPTDSPSRLQSEPDDVESQNIENIDCSEDVDQPGIISNSRSGVETLSPFKFRVPNRSHLTFDTVDSALIQSETDVSEAEVSKNINIRPADCSSENITNLENEVEAFFPSTTKKQNFTYTTVNTFNSETSFNAARESHDNNSQRNTIELGFSRSDVSRVEADDIAFDGTKNDVVEELAVSESMAASNISVEESVKELCKTIVENQKTKSSETESINDQEVIPIAHPLKGHSYCKPTGMDTALEASEEEAKEKSEATIANMSKNKTPKKDDEKLLEPKRRSSRLQLKKSMERKSTTSLHAESNREDSKNSTERSRSKKVPNESKASSQLVEDDISPAQYDDECSALEEISPSSRRKSRRLSSRESIQAEVLLSNHEKPANSTYTLKTSAKATQWESGIDLLEEVAETEMTPQRSTPMTDQESPFPVDESNPPSNESIESERAPSIAPRSIASIEDTPILSRKSKRPSKRKSSDTHSRNNDEDAAGENLSFLPEMAETVKNFGGRKSARLSTKGRFSVRFVDTVHSISTIDGPSSSHSSLSGKSYPSRRSSASSCPGNSASQTGSSQSSQPSLVNKLFAQNDDSIFVQPTSAAPKRKNKSAQLLPFVEDNAVAALPRKPQFPRLSDYIHPGFYKYLIEKMQAKYGIETNAKVVQVAEYIHAKVEEICWAKEQYPEEEIEQFKCVLARKQIVRTHYDFWFFSWKHLNDYFMKKAFPLFVVKNGKKRLRDCTGYHEPILSSAENEN